MKKTTLLVPLLFTSTAFSVKTNAQIEAKFAGASICSGQDTVIVSACNYNQQSSINLYAIGDNLVSIDESSLELTKLTIAGKNQLKDEVDRPNYELGYFARIKENGKVADFRIQIKSGLEKLDGPISMQGKLIAFSGSGLKTEESALFDPLDYPEMQIGPIKFIAQEANSINDKDYVQSLKDKGTLSDSNIELFEEMLNSGVVSKDKSLPKLDKDLRAAYPNLDEKTRKALGPIIMQFSMSDLFTDIESERSFVIEGDELSIDSIELFKGMKKLILREGEL